MAIWQQTRGYIFNEKDIYLASCARQAPDWCNFDFMAHMWQRQNETSSTFGIGFGQKLWINGRLLWKTDLNCGKHQLS